MAQNVGQAIAQAIVANAQPRAVRVTHNLHPLKIIELLVQTRQQGKKVVVFTTRSGSYYRMALGGKTAQPAISKWDEESGWSNFHICTLDEPGIWGLNTSKWKTTPIVDWSFETIAWVPGDLTDSYH